MPGSTKVWAELVAKMRAAGQSSAHVRVGVLMKQGGGDTHPDSDISLAELALIHEYGAPGAGIPERSFIRRTFINREGPLKTIIRRLAKAFVEDKIQLHKALDILGQWAAAQIKNTMSAGPHIPPPLKPATVARRAKGEDGSRSNRPLVDTARLMNAVSHEVVLSGGGE